MPVGTEMLNGFDTNVIQTDFQSNKAKYWVNQEYGLLINWAVTEGSKRTMAEVKQFSTARPFVAMLALPAACANAKAAAQITPAGAKSE